MKFYCHHSTGCYIEADTAESAQEQLCELIRDNIEPSHIEADPCEDGDTEGCDTANAPLHGPQGTVGEDVVPANEEKHND